LHDIGRDGYMDYMDYKKEIIELIESCDNIHWLKTIYAYIKRLIG
jgi:hypothetical protein